LCLAATGAVAWAGDAPSAPIVDESWQILIRPYNFNPADQGAYLRAQSRWARAAYQPAPAPAALAGGPEIAPANGAAREEEPRPASVEAPAPGPAPEPGPVPAGVEAPAAVYGPAAAPLLAAPPMMSYAEAYASIPFHRAEYEANPGYRHDAAIELMFGAMRPTTVIRQNTPYFSRYPDFYRYPFAVYPGYQRVDLYQYGTVGSPFAYPYGLRSPP
jgi:hypothetical protein